MADKKDDLDVIFSEKEIQIKKEIVTIRPYKFGQLPKVMKALEKVGGSLFSIMSKDSIDPADIIKLIGESTEDLFELVALSIDKDIEWLESLEMDEGVDVVVAVLEINSGFFLKRVLPKINTMLEKMNQQGGAR